MNFKTSETFYLIYFCVKIHFEDDGTQDQLVFRTTYSTV